MPNKFNSTTNSTKPPPTGKSGSKATSLDETTADWPGLPGKSGPDRSNGVKKVKTNAKSEGI